MRWRSIIVVSLFGATTRTTRTTTATATATTTTKRRRREFLNAFVLPDCISERRERPSKSLLNANSVFPKVADLRSIFDGSDGDDDDDDEDRSVLLGPVSASDTTTLFAKARAVMATDLAVKDPSLLSENFQWVGPSVASTGALGKADYVAAGQFFDLRSAFPDLDYRAHDYRIADENPLTVRLTARTVGTMRGPLRLRDKTLPPNGNRMICPPEAISITFEETTGKVSKICSGITMDRLVGNTAGLCGVLAAATIAGSPPSEWEIYPPVAVLQRFFARSVKQLDEPTAFLAPFPESVMIQLAKGVIAADNGASDPDVLSPQFTFSAPIVGPLKKDDFVKAFANFDIKSALPDLDVRYSNFRVDPYDPYRVWVDTLATGTRTGPLLDKEGDGAFIKTTPEAASFTFDDDGFCTRLTGGVAMDSTYGNTGGLGGIFGILYAAGLSLPGIYCRPLPQLISRLQKRLLQPISGVNVDDFLEQSKDDITPMPPREPVSTPKSVSIPSPSIQMPPLPSFSTIKRDSTVKPKQPKSVLPKSSLIPKPPAPPMKKSQTPPAKAAAAAAAAAEKREKQQAKLAAAKQKQSEALAAAQERAAKLKESQEAKAQERAAKLKEAQEAKAKKEAERVKALMAAKEASAAAAAKLKKDQMAANQKKAQATAAAAAAGKKKEAPPKIATAPRGVPTLKKWRQNRDGSITGVVFGSNAFSNGEKITTSEIKSKECEAGKVVVTESGSKYFLQ